MPGDYWQDEVFSVPPLAALEKTSASEVFDWMQLHLPFAGGRIDWGRARGNHRHRTIGDEQVLTAATAAEISARTEPGIAVEHVGDALSPYGVRFCGVGVGAITAALLEVPEHHYFLAEDRAWIVAVSFEGELDILDRLPDDPAAARPTSCPPGGAGCGRPPGYGVDRGRGDVEAGTSGDRSGMR